MMMVVEQRVLLLLLFAWHVAARCSVERIVSIDWLGGQTFVYSGLIVARIEMLQHDKLWMRWTAAISLFGFTNASARWQLLSSLLTIGDEDLSDVRSTRDGCRPLRAGWILFGHHRGTGKRDSFQPSLVWLIFCHGVRRSIRNEILKSIFFRQLIPTGWTHFLSLWTCCSLPMASGRCVPTIIGDS